MNFFGEESFFFFRAVELTAEIIDLRLQLGGLRPLGRRTASNWRISVLTRFYCGFLQRSNLLLIGIQLRLQIGFLFLNLRQVCFGFCRAIFCFSDFALLFCSGCVTRLRIQCLLRMTALSCIARDLRIRGIRAERFHFLDIQKSKKRREN